MINKEIENTGNSFNLQKYFEVRSKTLDLINTIPNKFYVGMNEAQGIKIIKDELNKIGTSKLWHPTKFRIGKNTLKSFREKSDEGITLEENDIFFIDIGPVFESHEADLGRTFKFGSSSQHQKIIDASREIFLNVKNFWKSENISGARLYNYAEKISKELGYTLNLNMKGHRLGDFPHALHYKGSLESINFKPIENLWVLEILIKNSENTFGAFFEDILSFEQLDY